MNIGGVKSGRKAHELVYEDESRAAGIQLIKRFTGGGTVVVDNDTVFATLIMEQSAFPDVDCFPRNIMSWSQDFYNPVFLPHGQFSLQEHGRLPLMISVQLGRLWSICLSFPMFCASVLSSESISGILSIGAQWQAM